MKYLKDKGSTIRHLISAPIIYSAIIPLVVTDAWFEIYHRTCFPLYKLPYVKRKNYVKIDRHKLEYLNWMQKVNCAYCGYANGLAAYWTKIAADTEQYWCGIQHQKMKGFIPPKHHEKFAKYDDYEDFKKKYL